MRKLKVGLALFPGRGSSPGSQLHHIPQEAGPPAMRRTVYMKTNKSTRRLLGALCGVGLMVMGAVAIGPGAASAADPGSSSVARDPGFCGVRHNMFHSPPMFLYVVRNQCSRTVSFAVWLPSVGRRATNHGRECLPIAAGGEGGYSDSWPDQNWTVVAC